MRLKFRLGDVSVRKCGEDHYDIRIANNFDKTNSSVAFLKKEELEQIRNSINAILKDGE
jgi:hypothetical protein